jgi:Flp pilus assembly protein TadG
MAKSDFQARSGRRSILPRTMRERGQSLVEFAVVLPVLLALVGVVIDASRVYHEWTNLESATRDAAQYLATSSTDQYSPNYTWGGSETDAKAKSILEAVTGTTFATSPTGGTLTNCSAPQVTTTYSKNTAWQDGGSASSPLSTARVSACLAFRTLFPYPFLTTDGAWTIRSDREITILVGR